MALKFDDVKALAESMQGFTKTYHAGLRRFLVEMGMRALGKTKDRTPVDTGALRERWELSGVFKNGNELYIVLFNPMEYASYVEDGHEQSSRFVPGHWEGKRFIYNPDGSEGMMLKTRWVPGKHMARISINEVEREMPLRLKRMLENMLQEVIEV